MVWHHSRNFCILPYNDALYKNYKLLDASWTLCLITGASIKSQGPLAGACLLACLLVLGFNIVSVFRTGGILWWRRRRPWGSGRGGNGHLGSPTKPTHFERARWRRRTTKCPWTPCQRQGQPRGHSYSVSTTTCEGGERGRWTPCPCRATWCCWQVMRGAWWGRQLGGRGRSPTLATRIGGRAWWPRTAARGPRSPPGRTSWGCCTHLVARTSVLVRWGPRSRKLWSVRSLQGTSRGCLGAVAPCCRCLEWISASTMMQSSSLWQRAWNPTPEQPNQTFKITQLCFSHSPGQW